MGFSIRIRLNQSFGSKCSRVVLSLVESLLFSLSDVVNLWRVIQIISRNRLLKDLILIASGYALLAFRFACVSFERFLRVTSFCSRTTCEGGSIAFGRRCLWAIKRRNRSKKPLDSSEPSMWLSFSAEAQLVTLWTYLDLFAFQDYFSDHSTCNSLWFLRSWE